MKQAGKYLQELIDQYKTPCVSYHIFDKDKIIYQFKSGFADVGKEIKVNAETTFNAFSVTKTFSALAILQLAEQKRVDIEQSAKNYLPGFPYSSAITIRQLLTHSAGIPNPVPLNWIHLAGEHASFDRNRFFNRIFLKHGKTRSNPNEKFSYSNPGYFLLGRIIENVSGIDYEQYINDNIIRKLDLQPKDLGFIINDAGKHAKGYIKRVSFSNMILGFFIDKSKYMAKAEGRWKPFKNYYVNGTSYGGLIGTSNAFVKYIQELLRPGCRLISGEFKKLLFTENFTTANKATGMCISWFSGKLNGKQYFSHAGGGGGYYCEIRIYPGTGLGSVITFNRTGMKDERFLNTVDKYFIDGN
jgi:CubicO group peptidase (beta-lactamase class C family)